MIGAQAIIRASQDQSPSGGASRFRQACLWAAFRQELYIGLKEHRPVRCSAPVLPPSDNLRDDWDWALCAVSDCAEAVNCVFGDSKSLELINHLHDRINMWQMRAPRSFEPLGGTNSLRTSASGIASFPLLAPCHAMAWQYNLVASALLSAHKPLPSVGPQRKQAARQMDSNIRSDVRKLCAIAESNGHVPAALVVASMGISICKFSETDANSFEQEVNEDEIEQRS